MKKNNKIVLLLSFVYIFFYGCGACKKNMTVRKIFFFSVFPVVQLNGNLTNFQDTTFIFFYKNHFLYKLPYEVGEIKKEASKKSISDTTSLEVVSTSEIRYIYFAGKKGAKYGYFYNSLIDTTFFKKGPLDSLAISRGIGTLDVYQITKTSILVASVYDKKNDEITKKYCPNIIGDDGDTILLYFSSKLQGIDFSLSKQLDSINNLKLYKIQIICNQKYSPTYNFVLPKREFLFEVKELPVDDPTDISIFLEKVKYI